MTGERFGILFVCTGNICRSAMAHYLLSGRLPAGGSVEVRSAGVAAVEGWPMDAPSALAMREHGVDASDHRSLRLTPEMVPAADLVLTATTAHRAEIIATDPSAQPRTFTLKEFVRSVDALAPLVEPTTDDLRARVAGVAAARHEMADGPHLNIADPWSGSLATARRCVADIAALTAALHRGLGLPG